MEKTIPGRRKKIAGGRVDGRVCAPGGLFLGLTRYVKVMRVGVLAAGVDCGGTFLIYD